MVKRWSYLSTINVLDPKLKLNPLYWRHTFKVFRKTTKFRRYSLTHRTNLSTIVRLKTMKITRKTEHLPLSIFINQWSRIYMRSKQFYRYYQAINLFTLVMPTFEPSAIKAALIKSSSVTNFFFFSCSKNVMSRYITNSSSNLYIKASFKHCRNCYAAAIDLDSMDNFDQVTAPLIFSDKNFFLPEEITRSIKIKNQIRQQLNNSLLFNVLIFSKIIKQVLIKLNLIRIYLLLNKHKN